MPRMSQRNRKRRKVAVKLPGGSTVMRFLKRKPSKARCAVTGEELHGIPRKLPVKMKRLPKTAKRPERPYGGVLSSRAMREKLKVEARINSQDETVTNGGLMEVGRLCLKLAGRDAGLTCVIVEVLDNNMVLIDGQTRRRKVNVVHLEPLKQVIKIKKKASAADVKKEFTKLKLEVKSTKPKKTPIRPKRLKAKKAPVKAKPKPAKETTKEEPKVETKTEKKSVEKKTTKKTTTKKPAAKKTTSKK